MTSTNQPETPTSDIDMQSNNSRAAYLNNYFNNSGSVGAESQPSTFDTNRLYGRGNSSDFSKSSSSGGGDDAWQTMIMFTVGILYPLLALDVAKYWALPLSDENSTTTALARDYSFLILVLFAIVAIFVAFLLQSNKVFKQPRTGLSRGLLFGGISTFVVATLNNISTSETANSNRCVSTTAIVGVLLVASFM